MYWGSEGAYSNSECVNVDVGYDGQASYSTLGCSSSGEFPRLRTSMEKAALYNNIE